MQTVNPTVGTTAPSRPAIPDRTRLLLEGPVLPTLLRLAGPNLGEAAARIAFIAFDAVFIAWLGTEALAGVSLVFPLFLVMQMMSAGGIGAGVAAAIARALGSGRRRDADALAAHAVALATGLAALSGLAMLAAGPALYRGMGAEGASLAAAIAYSHLVFGGCLVVWLMNTLANIVRGTGTMTVPAGAIVAGEAVHLLLSPALILGWGPVPQLGVTGAAIAVLASYATGSLILLVYLLTGRGAVRLALRPFRADPAHFRAILRVGGFGALNVVQMQATTLVATALVGSVGAAALAGYGAATRLELLQLPILFALGSAVITMVATNLGAGAAARARRIAWTGAAVSAAIGLGFAAVAVLMPAQWMSLFTAEPTVARAGADYLRIVGPTYPVFGFGLGLLFAAFGAGDALRPFLVSTARLATVVAGGGVAVMHPGGGLSGLFLAVAAASVMFGLGMLSAGGPLLRPAR